MTDRRVMHVPLIEALREAAGARWSGLIRVSAASESVGSLVLHEGRIAWATAKDQKDDFGGLLHREGVIDDEMLGDVRRRYQTVGKIGQLCDLIEEMGHGRATRTELRRLFLFHIRSVAHLILARADLSTTATRGQLEAERTMTFALDEIVVEDPENDSYKVRPSWTAGQTSLEPDATTTPSASAWVHAVSHHDAMAFASKSEVATDHAEGVLTRFARLRGYRGSMIASARGAILAVHGIEERDEVRKTARAVTALLGSQRNVEGLLGVGVAEYALLEGAPGSISLMWLDDTRQIALIVLLDERGRSGVLRYRMQRSLDELRAFVGKGQTRKRGETQ